MPKKTVTRDRREALRLALEAALLEAAKNKAFELIEVLDAVLDETKWGPLAKVARTMGDPIRLTAPMHARWVAEQIGTGHVGQIVIRSRRAARVVFGLFQARSSPISDHLAKRWAMDAALARALEEPSVERDDAAIARALDAPSPDADAAQLVRLLEARPAADGEDLVRRTMAVVQWPKVGNLFSARDHKTKRLSSNS